MRALFIYRHAGTSMFLLKYTYNKYKLFNSIISLATPLVSKKTSLTSRTFCSTLFTVLQYIDLKLIIALNRNSAKLCRKEDKMEHKITIRLSDKEYDILEMIAKHYNNNKSKAVREIISNFSNLVQFVTPTRKILEEYNQMKDDLPFT